MDNPPRRARYAGLDGLRAVAVALVIAYHLFPGWIFAGGFVGVDVFFVLSGFLIAGSLERCGSLISFLGLRALRIVPAQVTRIEALIDAATAQLPPLASFVLPGGTPAAAALHLARAIVRRAERSAVAAGVEGDTLRFLNRLSDYLFCASRIANGGGANDVTWVPGAQRQG